VRIAPFVAVCLLVAGTARAQESIEASNPQAQGLQLYDHSLAKESFRAGTTSLNVYAGSRVDVAELMKSARVSRNDTPETIHDKVDAVRRRLYPTDPLILEVSPAASRGASTGSTLVKGYYGWNYAGGWWAIWASTTAVLFVDDIRGAYNVYDCYPCGGWKFRGTYRTGGVATRYNYGAYVYRGFSIARGAGSQTDFVMYFFR
jgi:hypothetical protein